MSKTNSHWTWGYWKGQTDKPIITVDFDHTITSKCLACSDGLDGDGIQEGCREALIELSKKYRIWILTGSYDFFNQATPKARTVKAIKRILDDNKIPYERILQIKPPAIFMIDDRAVHHKGWAETMNEIRLREVGAEK
jgi:hypothetical protein